MLNKVQAREDATALLAYMEHPDARELDGLYRRLEDILDHSDRTMDVIVALVASMSGVLRSVASMRKAGYLDVLSEWADLMGNT